MVSRITIGCAAGLVILSAASLARSQQNPYRLKEPDEKKLCISCHTDFEQKLKSRFIHTPVRTGDCSGCHNPHVSAHGKLLSDDPGRICTGCHDGVVPANAKSIHKVVIEGQCDKCHDPHGSDNSANLVAKGNDLCASCHKELAASARNAKFKHSPVQQGCLTCHGPHASERGDHLLKNDVPAGCVTCHKPDSPAFLTRHDNYPVGKASCTTCHDPHGSNQPALLQANVHAPLSTGRCNQCHEAPGASVPFATKRPGSELCKGCHAEMVNGTMAKRRLHWPVADKSGCVSCHNPHASKHQKLVKAETAQLCGTCHADTMKRIGASAVKHAPVAAGTCVACHSPHGSDTPGLLAQGSLIKTCTNCHNYESHSAHPIGDQAVDPRNKNLRVDCLSCHAAHGGEFKHILLADTNVELCTRCHQKFGR